MDRIFYSVEQWAEGKKDFKMICILGEIRRLHNSKKGACVFAQFTNALLEIEDIQESGGKFMEYIYNDGKRVYEKDITEAEAEECFKTYFNGRAGTEFDIYECNQDTPCGDYWCEM